MRVLYWIPYENGLGADRWIYDGWRFAFTDLGHEFFALTAQDDWHSTIAHVQPDLLFCPNFVDLPRHKETLRRARKDGVVVFVVADWPMSASHVNVITEDEVADVYFGEREPGSMREFVEVTGRPYVLIPNAADRHLHFPTDPAPEYDFDVVYLGANLPKKRAFFENVLRPLRRKYRVGLFGPGWTARDGAARIAQGAFRRAGLVTAADSVNRRRLSVPPERENVLYSSAAVALNAHEREPDGSQPHYIVNQRAFKIPACGGLEICDDVPALRKYFSRSQVVTATSPGEWLENVDHFLGNVTERERVRRAGTERALRDHTYHNRVDEVASVLESMPRCGGVA